MLIRTQSHSSLSERIEINSAATLIEKARFPLREEEKETLIAVVEAECVQIQQSEMDQQYAAMRNAEAEAELAKTRLATGSVALDLAKSKAGLADRHGSWLKVVIWSVCAAACFAAEFVLSWNALCFVLNVDKWTVLGVLLGLAPPSGLAVLEVVLARLFEEPWQRVRSQATSARGLAIQTAMVAMLALLAAGNGTTIWHLAKAREVAVHEEDVLNRDLPPAESAELLKALDRGAVDQAVTWVSLIVTVDGAIFLLLCLAAGKELHNRRIADRQLVKALEEHKRLESEEAKTASEADGAREGWKTVHDKATSSAERYRTHCMYLLAHRTAVAMAQQTLEDQVSFELSQPRTA